MIAYLSHTSGFKFSQLEMSEFRRALSIHARLTHHNSTTEAVLTTLISAFKFERSETPIFWNFAGISYPTTIKGSIRPEMYLKVTMASA